MSKKRPFKPDWFTPLLPAIVLTVGINMATNHPEWNIVAKLVFPFCIYSAMFNLTNALLRKMKDDDE